MLSVYPFEHVQTDASEYENFSLSRISFYTFKQQSDLKSLITKSFDENTLKNESCKS